MSTGMVLYLFIYAVSFNLKTMSYLYETHLHTSFASACARSKGSEYIMRYQDLGYSGIMVTDHFFHGNTSVPRRLFWKEWVNQFCRGYEEAKNEGDKLGFDVFFGWEETFEGCDDYLVYGLDKAWLLEHPEVRDWTRGGQYRTVHASGGCVVQAHPFRQYDYIRKVVLSTGCVDAVEAGTMGNNNQSYDALAMRYALKLGLPVTAGTDIHDAMQVYPGGVFGVFVEKKLETIRDYVHAVLNDGISGISVCEGRFDRHGGEKVTIPVDIRDMNDRSTGKNWREFV
jgi:hypothetical protein